MKIQFRQKNIYLHFFYNQPCRRAPGSQLRDLWHLSVLLKITFLCFFPCFFRYFLLFYLYVYMCTGMTVSMWVQEPSEEFDPLELKLQVVVSYTMYHPWYWTKLCIIEDTCSKSSIMERTRTLPQVMMGKKFVQSRFLKWYLLLKMSRGSSICLKYTRNRAMSKKEPSFRASKSRWCTARWDGIKGIGGRRAVRGWQGAAIESYPKTTLMPFNSLCVHCG